MKVYGGITYFILVSVDRIESPTRNFVKLRESSIRRFVSRTLIFVNRLSRRTQNLKEKGGNFGNYEHFQTESLLLGSWYS